ncbi:MAG: glycosyltransferase family 39 protein [Acidobacteriota bacterium]
MAPIAATEIAERRPSDRARSLAVLGVFLLAAAGQLALERAHVHGTTPPLLFAAIAFAGAAGLAIAALRKTAFLPDLPRPLDVPRYSPMLYAACLPGAICLFLPLLLHGRSAEREGDMGPAMLWLVGLGLLVLPGVWDWLRRPDPRTTAQKRDRRRLGAAALFLFAFAFAIRIWGGIDRVPGFLDSDEATTGIDGRESFARGPGELFGFWEMGNPNLTLFVSQVAARPFGEGLKALRLGSALLGSLAVVLLFDFGRRLIGTQAALLAALLLAVNHVFVHYSRVGQIYIDTPFFASLVLALLLRVLTGGSFLALTAAGIALGLGAATYISTEILPFVVGVTLLGWAMALRWPARRVLPVAAFLAAAAALTCAPMVATILRITPEIAYQRVPAISALRPEGLRQLVTAYRAGNVPEAIGRHVLHAIGIFNFGSDHFKAYGADRPMNDPVSGALVPVAAALLFWRLSSPMGWMSVVFAGAYLTGGVLFVAGQPSYHRVAVVLLFSCLAVAWTLAGLARALASSRRLPRWTPTALAFAVVAASAWLNLRFYFGQSPVSRLIEARFGVGALICLHAGASTVLDATPLEGHGYVPPESAYADLDCPGVKIIRIGDPARLPPWSELTGERRVVLLVPTAVEPAGPGWPRGYRLVRRTVDRSIRRPAELSISVLEFERAP